MKEGITVINVMADGTICEDLSKYITKDRKLPENAARMILKFMRDGHVIHEKNGG